jgi:hypothetical protein
VGETRGAAVNARNKRRRRCPSCSRERWKRSTSFGEAIAAASGCISARPRKGEASRRPIAQPAQMPWTGVADRSETICLARAETVCVPSLSLDGPIAGPCVTAGRRRMIGWARFAPRRGGPFTGLPYRSFGPCEKAYRSALDKARDGQARYAQGSTGRPSTKMQLAAVLV